MATKTSRPVRTLVVFLLVIGAMFAGAAAVGSWKPRLGLDLQGGTRITLQARAEGGGGVTEDKLNEATDIISQRVNGAGVAEAEVTTQGSDIIIVEIPGKSSNQLERSLGSTAQLRFRLVEQALPPVSSQGQPGAPSPGGPTSSGPTQPSQSPGSSGSTTPSDDKPTAQPGGTSPSGTSGTVEPKNRVSSSWFAAAAKSPGKDDGDSPGNPQPTSPPPALQPPDLEQIPDPLSWQPSQEWQAKLAQFQCPGTGKNTEPQIDLSSQPLLACDEEGNRYLLGPALVEGTQVTDASAGIPPQGVNPVVNLEFDGDATTAFADLTQQIAGTGQQFAIVLDGEVISAPVVNSVINDGRAMIEGSTQNPFTQDSASSLANSLKYGALPLSFDTQSVTNEGPELASSQLDAGIIAGIIGLLLVVGYCILYYRGLAVVVVTSLVIAGLMTYASVLLLGEAYGFTLTLPGIAGLIVAVGITADSFIVYFERLRDEVREGRTLRTSVETGWARAKHTILAADSVSFLAALVLFIFAIGVVKGFAFALGLTTLIDVFVVFFFTKPMVTLLARTKFFGQGHKFSGLDRGHLGMPPLRRSRPAGGEA